jgi:RimJ/RimL family protein N-acetyltransferase
MTVLPFERVSWPRRTPRLTLRPATAEDVHVLFELHSHPDVGRWEPHRPASYEEYALRVGELSVLDRTLVVDRAGGFVGSLYLHVTPAWSQTDTAAEAGEEAEIGWSLSPTQQGNGYATEAAAELLRICFTDLGVRRVTAHAFAANAPSLRVMDRLGLRQEGYNVCDSLHRDLGWVDGVSYAVLVDEWQSRA